MATTKTFGNTTFVGYNTAWTTENTIQYPKFLMNVETATCTGVSITAQINCNDAAFWIKFAIYKWVSDWTGTLLANSETEQKHPINAVVQTITCNFGATKPILLSNTKYYIVAWSTSISGASGCTLTGFSSGGLGEAYENLAYAAYPASISGFYNDTDAKGCIYCTYTIPENFTRTAHDTETLTDRGPAITAAYSRAIPASLKYDSYKVNDDSEFEMNSVNWDAQTFTASDNYGIGGVNLKLWKSGNPGTVTVSIRAVNGGTGKPDGADLAVGTYNGNSLGNSPGAWVYIPFTSILKLTKGTVYAICVRGTSDYVEWRRDATSAAYTGGNGFQSTDSGASWSSPGANIDAMFETCTDGPENWRMAITDSINTSQGWNRTLTDTETITDVLTHAGAYYRTASDIETIAESIDIDYVPGGTDWTRDLSDTVTLAESLAHAGAYYRTATDTETITDLSRLISQGWNRPLSDSMTIADSLAHSGAYYRTAQDTEIITDLSRTLVQGWGRILADTETIAESLSIQANYYRNKTDTEILSDSLAHQSNYYRNESDNEIIAESLSISSVYQRLASDLENITDSLSLTAEYYRDISDVESIAESISLSQGWNRILTDSIAITDLLSILVSFNIPLSDSLPITDSIELSQGWGRNLTDTLTMTDLLDLVAEYYRDLTDTETISDLLSLVQESKRDLTDTLSITDTFNLSAEYYRNPTDILILSDQLLISQGLSISLNDSESISDALELIALYNRTASETLTLNDTLGYIIDWGRMLSDTVALSDSISIAMGLNIPLTDTMSLSDSLSLTAEYYRTASDIETIMDALSITAVYYRNPFETLVITESFYMQFNMMLYLYDKMTLSDSISVWCGELSSVIFFWDGGTLSLHKPYWVGLNSSINYTNTNMYFRSGHYASYIDEVGDAPFSIMGYENVSAMAKFTTLAKLADDGVEITITNLNLQYDGTYVIESLTYKPIGLNVFEYRITFKKVREFI